MRLGPEESLGLPLTVHPCLLRQPLRSEISTQLLVYASLLVPFVGSALDLREGLRLLTLTVWIAMSTLEESWL